MKKADMKVYRERLLDLRARLRGDVSSMADSALRKSGMNGEGTASMPIHMAELGSENYEQEFTLSLLATEGNRLEMIESALDRVEAGTYGQCVHCEKVVPKTRLNAIPYTPLCIKCAELRSQGKLEMKD
ncbi:TraR/DksA family transcriptional regulator [Adhaeretor mobilis]|nr:TraR/DksA family transcriptional regulator [Adhaeretor mobilis]